MALSKKDNMGVFIHQTDLALTNYAKKKLAPYNIAPEQSLILLLLHRKGGLTQKAIAQVLNKDKVIITRMVNSLEGKNIIQRTVDPNDKRLQLIDLTDKGQEIVEEVVPLSQKINEKLCQGISLSDLDKVVNVLSQMRQNIP